MHESRLVFCLLRTQVIYLGLPIRHCLGERQSETGRSTEYHLASSKTVKWHAVELRCSYCYTLPVWVFFCCLWGTFILVLKSITDRQTMTYPKKKKKKKKINTPKIDCFNSNHSSIYIHELRLLFGHLRTQMTYLDLPIWHC